MTILGKILLFFVLILSLIWTGLTVNAYVTRTNWANDAKKWKDQAELAKQSADYQRKLAEDTRNAAAAQIATLRTTISSLQGNLDAQTKSAAEARQQLAQMQDANMAGDPQAKLLQANIAKLQKQVDLLQASLNTMEKTANEAVVAAEKAKGDALRADIERNDARRRADELQEIVFNLRDQVSLARSGDRGGNSRLAPPDDFRATVTKVDGDLVEINLGANAKLQRGAVLSVSRHTPAPKYLGTITITQVDPHGAVGQFSPPSGVTRPNPADLPKAGDIVSVVK
jgi:hypothetical protein